MFPDIELIIFDLDGTIAQLDIDWKRLKKELIEKFGPDFEYIDRGIEKASKRIQKEAYKIIETYELENIANLIPNEKIIDIIRNLRNKRLALFSTNMKKTAEVVVDRLGLQDFFSPIIAKEDVVKHKPYPEGLLRILDLTRVDRKKTIYIGDSDKDFEAGKKARIETWSAEQLLERWQNES